MTHHAPNSIDPIVVSSRRFEGPDPAQPKYDGWKVILIWLAVAIVPWAIIGGFIWSAGL